jgi:PAS domain-containing protein
VARIGSWEVDVRSGHFATSSMFRELLALEIPSAGPAEQRFPVDAFLTRVHPEGRGRVAAAIAANNSRDGLEHEYRIVLPGGATRVIHHRGEVVRDADGERVTLRGTIQDVTDRRRLDTLTRVQAQLLDEVGAASSPATSMGA